LFSPFSSFDGYSQRCSFPNQPNRDKISTRTFDVGVFTQPGPKADIETSFYLEIAPGVQELLCLKRIGSSAHPKTRNYSARRLA
jgi:hypothetical protein